MVFNHASGGSKFKGDYHLLFNNSFYNSYFAVPSEFGNTPPHNRHTLVRNNLADMIVAWTPSRPDEKVNARLENNLRGNGVVRQSLRDPANLDFRPKPGSAVIDMGRVVSKTDRPSERIRFEKIPFVGNAPDIGAYEAGNSNYWIPGRKQRKASTPIPPHGADNVKQDADLIFLEAHDAKRHIVHFTNTAKDHKGKVELNDSNITDPGELRAGDMYYWRVDAVSRDGSIRKGTVWSFKTRER